MLCICVNIAPDQAGVLLPQCLVDQHERLCAGRIVDVDSCAELHGCALAAHVQNYFLRFHYVNFCG